jgi:hypothetical protein
MEALWDCALRTDQRRILKRAQMLLMWWQTLPVGDRAAHYVQFMIDRLVLTLIYSGPSLFRVCSGRLTLVQLVQSAVSLTLLALLAAATVASWRIRQWRQGGLSAHTD